MKKLVGLIGYPVSHSMSPEMHNAAFQKSGLPFYYDKYEVHPDRLEEAIYNMRTKGFAGWNVTIPHKQTIMPYLDKISDEAKKIGAVNTVLNENGKLIGYNTDGAGFVKGLIRHVHFPIEQANVLIIGAGGASRAIGYALAQTAPKSIVIANRTMEKARDIQIECLREHDKVMSLQEAAAVLSDFQIVINTTSIGMKNDGSTPIDLHHLAPGTVLSDIIYNPYKTAFLQEGEKRGAVIDNGVSMLVLQGALSFEKWTGMQPDIELMETIVIEKLGGNYVNR
ncbi:shikimate dehydrogenase [Fictibacillus sp. KIGAM418]|uniref:Shikimate dehydrogenase (NADP(+)) n=1 Tax=Fictibacillus marinisediminis TaxID=2878389 RepID=A0A9X2BDL9_9BACL|nr:shikimate dehydrogenase [Fictibacillus marinisediminis]MCK6257786.1 shikimate dehydrogenase [Fictibacillus marinisediminis]